MARILFTSDLHLTDRPQDEYRWSIFDFLHKEGRLRGVDSFAILGDLTDAKDGHSARLVNRIVGQLEELSQRAPVVILKGNHDYTEESGPFFKFLDHFPRIRFITTPEIVSLGDELGVFVPHVRYRPDPEPGNTKTAKTRVQRPLFSKQVVSLLREPHKFRCFHQTFKGALIASGTHRERVRFGVETSIFCPLGIKKKGFVHISGDVHIPQKVGPFHYCGSPHPINFGDDFDNRVLFWNSETLISIPRVTIRKMVVKLNEKELFLPEGIIPSDQVRVEVWLSREGMAKWRTVRHALFAQANRNGISIESIQFHCTESAFVPEIQAHQPIEVDPIKALDQYGEENSLSRPLLKVGKRVLRGCR